MARNNKGGTGAKARAADHEKATAWDKISARDVTESAAWRDIHSNQQLDRSKIERVRSASGVRTASIALGGLVAVAAWVLVVVVEWQMDNALVMLRRIEAPREFSQVLWTFPLWRVVVAVAAGAAVAGVAGVALWRQLQAQNLMHDTADINQYENDQYLTTPEELVRELDWFPDAGAHSSVSPTIPLSHVMLSNKGLERVPLTRRVAETVHDGDGEIVEAAGEAVCDDDGEPVVDMVPMIDEKFGEDLFTASGVPVGKAGKAIRLRFDASVVPYNPGGKDRSKLGRHETVADLVNADWELPDYEVQRPAGAYLVTTAPANTMVLAITRAGKGQTVIEPTIDMWSREKTPQNMLVNDPKGELLLKNYVPFTRRGYRVVQFNLMQPMKTDVYNPLGLAAEAMRDGDVVKCAAYVENIADTFFPKTSGDNLFWDTAAANAFKRIAYGLIDFAMEEERLLRAKAAKENMSAKLLAQRIDELWGKVTLYNCYQFFVQLASKKRKVPTVLLKEKTNRGEFGDLESDDFDHNGFALAKERAEAEAVLWGGQAEMDLLSLYFAATEMLPQNSIRTLVANANNSLKSMGGADKTISTVYGVAITAMSFFTDPTIMRLTSGTPSQNVDMGGLSFPRRLGVRFSPEYLAKQHLVGTRAVWSAYADAGFARPLGKDFDHSDTVSPEGWARYYFEGVFDGPSGFLKLELRNQTTDMLVKTFRFRFDKGWQTSLDGRVYVTDPVTKMKIVQNGVLVELSSDDGGRTWRPGNSMFDQQVLVSDGGRPQVTRRPGRVFAQTSVRYTERPISIFCVTPPHLTSYAKLMLVLIKQLVDLNFDRSYITKENQKPLRKTRFMLDEVGNLQSEGHGIADFQTMLSIGLGQDQQFILILQTLQQLRDVYGESVDEILQGNVANLIFLKSNDTSMLEKLEKLSGTRHVVYRDSKTVTKDVENVVEFMNVEGKVSYTMNTREEPVIKANDMLYIGDRQSMVFRIGQMPIWNRDHMILPMSHKLYDNTITVPGRTYTQQTMPTLSTVADYDPRLNQPDFLAMLEGRKAQAVEALGAMAAYKEAFGHTDADVARIDPDVYSDAVMSLIDSKLAPDDEDDVDDSDYPMDLFMSVDAPNDELAAEMAAAEAVLGERDAKRYAMGTLGRSDVNASIGFEAAVAYGQCKERLWNDPRFRRGPGGGLLAADGTVLVEQMATDPSAIEAAMAAAGSRVYGEPGAGLESASISWGVTEAFYGFLRSLDSWDDLAGGDFDMMMAGLLRARE